MYVSGYKYDQKTMEWHLRPLLNTNMSISVIRIVFMGIFFLYIEENSMLTRGIAYPEEHILKIHFFDEM